MLSSSCAVTTSASEERAQSRGPIDEPAALQATVRGIPGVVDLGLFLEMADLVLVGDPRGVRELRR